MEVVEKVSEENIDLFIKYIPREWSEEYFFEERLEVYGIRSDGEVCGIVVLEREFGDVLIRYLYVEKEYQSALNTIVDLLAYECCQMGGRRFVWKFLEDGADWKLKMEQMGFQVIKSDIAVFHFEMKELSKVALMTAKSKNVIPLSDLDTVSLKKLSNEMLLQESEIIKFPIRKDDYIADCSAVFMEKNEPKAIMLLKRDENGELYIPYIYSKAKDPMAIVDMIRFMFRNANERFEEHETCVTYVVQPVLVKIIEKLTGVKGQYQYVAMRNFELTELAVSQVEKIFAE